VAGGWDSEESSELIFLKRLELVQSYT
jgi:hypothetical protein